MITTDYLIIGSGIAGLNLALKLAEIGEITIVTKSKLHESSSYLAQGGIAAVVDYKDSFEEHIKNTLEAGCYHNDKKAVKFLVENAPRAIKRLKSLGVRFESEKRKEGGHSFPRIHHTLDQTGKNIWETLAQKILSTKSITLFEDTPCLELIKNNKKCCGAVILQNKKIKKIAAKCTILCTGGIGQLYTKTTNPNIATGDGIAIANRIGAKYKDLEFVQFHPTGFSYNNTIPFLLSETLRGAGGILRNKDGDDFMKNYHKDGSLAPRDIVVKAMFEEENKGQIYLDMRKIDNTKLDEEFPFLYTKLKEYNLDLHKDLIPVTPAAHFSCGGIKVNISGESSVQNLYALGEVACTGIHGANRLASNAILENIVFAKPIIESVAKMKTTLCDIKKIKDPDISAFYPNKTSIQSKIKETMWNLVGIQRSEKGLNEALEILQNIPEPQDYETKNMLEVAILITKAALERKESLGTHWME